MSLKTALFALLLICAAALAPQSAWAATSPCAPGNATDAAYAQAAAAAAGAKESALQKFWTGLPKTNVGQSYCGQQLITFFNDAYNALSPLLNFNASATGAMTEAAASMLGGVAGTFLGNLANQVCTSTVGSIVGSVDNSATNLARICLPLSNFGFGGWNLGFNINGCSGSTQVQYVTGSAPSIAVSSPYGGASGWFPP